MEDCEIVGERKSVCVYVDRERVWTFDCKRKGVCLYEWKSVAKEVYVCVRVRERKRERTVIKNVIVTGPDIKLSVRVKLDN